MHISSGGVVYRKNDGLIEILLLYRKDTDSYHLPKGTQKKGESLKDTSLREIEEETGLKVELEKYLGALFSDIDRGGKKVRKKTHYFLARYIAVCSCHDSEHDQVEFVSPGEAINLLKIKRCPTFEKEFEILEVARNILLSSPL